jgi:hypothetical protein
MEYNCSHADNFKSSLNMADVRAALVHIVGNIT